MGTRFHLMLHDGDPDVLDELCVRLAALDAMWSRFRPDSEISRLNAAPESFHIVSTATVDLIDSSIAAWILTGGTFDPTVLHALEASGYDRSFEQCGNDRPVAAPRAAPGCSTIEVDHRLGMVRLGAGVGFDPGGIGKGLAADRLVAHGLALGAAGVMVNIGGDVVCGGAPPSDGGWVVAVREPQVSDEQIAVVVIDEGAVVTSTTAKRTWLTGDGARHHLIDPATGRCTSGPVLATVVASSGWYAETVAKQLLVGSDRAALDTDLAAALVVDQAGTITHLGRMNDFVR